MKIKKLKHRRILIIVIIFFAFFWVLAPAPNWNLPSELIYRSLLPKYPNAKNIQNTLGCGFEFEVEENELKKVKTFYENSLIIKTLFDFQKGRSHSHTRSGDNGGYHYRDFSNYYYQKFNLSQRGLRIYGANYSSGTRVRVECKNWSFF